MSYSLTFLSRSPGGLSHLLPCFLLPLLLPPLHPCGDGHSLKPSVPAAVPSEVLMSSVPPVPHSHLCPQTSLFSPQPPYCSFHPFCHWDWAWDMAMEVLTCWPGQHPAAKQGFGSLVMSSPSLSQGTADLVLQTQSCSQHSLYEQGSGLNWLLVGLPKPFFGLCVSAFCFKSLNVDVEKVSWCHVWAKNHGKLTRKVYKLKWES